MAYRAPESTIYLLKGCPCDPEYNNTIYFENKTQQWAYFRTLSVQSYTNQYYQRYERGYLRIQARADDLYGVNYMVFSNDPRFSALNLNVNDIRIFYCFVDNVEYINENTTEVHYEIDRIQTYMFDYTLGQCFVEREHTITDNLYEHLIEEDFAPQNYTESELYSEIYSHWVMKIDYVPNTQHGNQSTIISSWKRVNTDLQLTTSTINFRYDGSVRNDIPSAIYSICIPLLDNEAVNYASWLTTVISEIVNISGVVAGLKIIPYEMCGDAWSNNTAWSQIVPEADHPVLPYKDIDTVTFQKTLTNISLPTYFTDGRGSSNNYTPKNNKLNSSPYKLFKITNSQGEKQELMPEHFTYNHGTFKIVGCATPTPEITLIPTNYNGQSDNIDQRISNDVFPESVWSEDTAQRFITENRNKINMALLGSAITFAGGIGTYMALAGSTFGASLVSPMASNALMNVAQPGTPQLPVGNIVNEPIRNSLLKPHGIWEEKFGIKDRRMANIGTAGLASTVGSLLDLSKKRDSYGGKQSYTSILPLLNKFGFRIIYKCIKPYDARRIDDYFSAFGYAIKQLKVPNIASAPVGWLRPCWNYVKNTYTVILPREVDGVRYSVSAEDEEILQSIYNKGITFWMDGGEVGDYSLDNSPQI